MWAPEDLAALDAGELYDALDALAEYRQAEGRQRTPEAAHVRLYVKEERARVKAELRRRGLPTTRPDDQRAYGPGQAHWQGALHSDCDRNENARDRGGER